MNMEGGTLVQCAGALVKSRCAPSPDSDRWHWPSAARQRGVVRGPGAALQGLEARGTSTGGVQGLFWAQPGYLKLVRTGFTTDLILADTYPMIQCRLKSEESWKAESRVTSLRHPVHISGRRNTRMLIKTGEPECGDGRRVRSHHQLGASPASAARHQDSLTSPAIYTLSSRHISKYRADIFLRILPLKISIEQPPPCSPASSRSSVVSLATPR
jgi:hypothetical protein